MLLGKAGDECARCLLITIVMMNDTKRTGSMDTPLFAASESVWFSRIGCPDRHSFRVNDSPSRSFRFEDLSGLYLKAPGRSVYCCSIQCTDKSYQICRLSEEEFWEIVKGKHFKVIVDNATKRLLESAYDTTLTLADNICRVFSLLDAGKEDELQNVLKKSPCYQFVEIPN